MCLKRAEIISLRHVDQDSSDDIDDQTKLNKIDPIQTKKILELDQYLETLYSSMDSNHGILEDIHLIP